MKKDKQSAGCRQGWRLVQWVAALGVSLLSLHSQAYSTVHLKAVDVQAAAEEMASRLGYSKADACQLVALDPVYPLDENPERSFRVDCPKKALLLKDRGSLDGQTLASVEAWLGSRLPPDLLARIQKPVGVFSFEEKGKGRRYYTAWARQPHSSLGDWIADLARRSSSGPDGVDRERLRAVHQQTGSLLGDIQRAVLLDKGDSRERARLLPQAPVWPGGLTEDLHLVVTPADQVLVDLETVELIARKAVSDASAELESPLFKEGPPSALRAATTPVLEPLHRSMTEEFFETEEESKEFFGAWMPIVEVMLKTSGAAYCQTLGEAQQRVRFCVDQEKKKESGGDQPLPPLK